jgi:protein involved in ribonucleotide reduction
MVFSCYTSGTVRFINKEEIESFQISKDKTVSGTYDTVYIKDTNSVAVSSGFGDNACIDIIDIESKKVMTTISMDTAAFGMAVRDL